MRTIEVRARGIGTIPLLEVSGLAVGQDHAGRLTVTAIGDRHATIAWAAVDGDVTRMQWQTLDLSHAAGTRIPDTDPQLEAIAVDGTQGVLLVQEFPNRAEFIDAPARRVRAHLTLDIPDVPGIRDLHDSWQDPDGSHAEGVVLLRGGHLLVVKEKDPGALLEFGPAGDAARGFTEDRWLAPGESWHVADGDVVMSLLAVWRPDSELLLACPDFSDAVPALHGALAILGDQARAIAIVVGRPPAADPMAGTFSASELWLLSGVAAKPEGVAVLPDGDVLVACDRKKVKENLFRITGDLWAG